MNLVVESMNWFRLVLNGAACVHIIGLSREEIRDLSKQREIVFPVKCREIFLRV